MKSPYWNSKQAAAYLNMSVHTLRKKAQRGEIHPIRTGDGPKPRQVYTQEICDAYYRQTPVDVRRLRR